MQARFLHRNRKPFSCTCPQKNPKKRNIPQYSPTPFLIPHCFPLAMIITETSSFPISSNVFLLCSMFCDVLRCLFLYIFFLLFRARACVLSSIIIRIAFFYKTHLLPCFLGDIIVDIYVLIITFIINQRHYCNQSRIDFINFTFCLRVLRGFKIHAKNPRVHSQYASPLHFGH